MEIFAYLNEDKTSWVSLKRDCIPLSAEEFKHVWSTQPQERPVGKMFDKNVIFPRKTASFGKDYTFSGQTAESVSSYMHDIPFFYKIEPYLDNANGCLMNWYDAEKQDYIGLHSDDEKEIVSDSPIVSISWSTEGHFRRFRLKPKNSKGLYPNFGEGPGIINLYNGDLLIMGGQCQKTHKHEIMKARKTNAKECRGRRINVTLREFKQ